MKLSKTLVIPVAILLVALGAGAVLASTTSSPAASGTTVAPAAESPSASPAASPKVGPLKAAQDETLTTVLDDLVAKGTITAAQEQAIKDGLTAERAKQQADRKAKMDALKAQAAAAQGLPLGRRDHAGRAQPAPGRQPDPQAHQPDGRRQDHDRRAQVDRPGLRLRSRLRRRFGHFGGFGRGFGHLKNDASPAPSPATGG